MRSRAHNMSTELTPVRRFTSKMSCILIMGIFSLMAIHASGANAFSAKASRANKADNLICRDALSRPLKSKSRTYNFKSLWLSPELKLKALSFFENYFGSATELRKKFIEQIEIVVFAGASDQFLYQRLNQFLVKHRHELGEQQARDEQMRINRRIEQLADISQNNPRRYLDLGAGDGKVALGVSQKLSVPPSQVFGVEVADYPSQANIQWLNYDSDQKLGLEDHTVDLITVLMVLHHVEDQSKLLSELRRLISDKGEIIVRETDGASDKIKSFNQTLDTMFYHVFSPNESVPTPAFYRSRAEWIELFNQHRFQVKTIETNEPGNPFSPVYFKLRPQDPIRVVRLPSPADWISGQLPESLHSVVGDPIHKRFFERTKFDRLSVAYFQELEKDLRFKLAQLTSSPIENDLLQFELATVIAQAGPYNEERMQEAFSLTTAVLTRSTLPLQLVQAAESVQTYLSEVLNEKVGPRILKQVNWAISNRCPLCCVGCYFNFRSDQMTLHQARLVAINLKKHGTEEIILTGGDPLLAGVSAEKKEIEVLEQSDVGEPQSEFLSYVNMLHELGFRVAVDTTGYTLTEETVRQLEGKVSYIGIPLDGSSQEVIQKFRKGQKDLFDRTIQTLDMLSKYNIPVKLNSTVTQANIEDLGELAKLVDQKGYGSRWPWSIFQWWETRAEASVIQRMAVDNNSYSKKVAAIQTSYPNLHLRIGSVENRSRNYFEIMTNGDVLNYSEGIYPGSIIMGNVLQDNIDELVMSPIIRQDSPKFKAWFK